MPRSIARRAAACLLLAAIVGLAGCNNSGVGASSVAGQKPSGQIELTAVQAAYIGSGSGGSGTLFFNGNSYPFNIGGAGIGGIGVSKMEGYGEVYNLTSLRQFPGAYAQARYGIAVGNLGTGGGDLWLQNDAGVIMHIKAKRQGLMLSLGGDAMVVSLK